MISARLVYLAVLACLFAACASGPQAQPEDAPSCSGFETDVKRVWSGGARARVGTAATNFGAELSASEVKQVVTKLDQSSGDWVHVRYQLCRDHEAKRVATPEYATRTRCLDDWLLRMRSFTLLLERGRAQNAESLLHATDQLADRLAACNGEPASTTVLAPAQTSRGWQAAAETSDSPGPAYARSLAVVIGIDDYEYLLDLRAAEADAKAVSEALQTSGFEVRMLLGKQATREAIVGLLGDELPRGTASADRVFVFFAGHGVSVGAADNSMGYLMPWSGKPQQPIASGISMTELQAWLASYAAKHVLFVADACYSGLALPNRAASIQGAGEQYMRMVTREPVRFTLVAGQDNQEAWEMRSERRGAFTHYFLEAISGDADANRDGMITASEVVHYVTDRTFRYV